jgi:hypothetical protein
MVDTSHDDGKDRLFSLVAVLTHSLDRNKSRRHAKKDLSELSTYSSKGCHLVLIESIVALTTLEECMLALLEFFA